MERERERESTGDRWLRKKEKGFSGESRTKETKKGKELQRK